MIKAFLRKRMGTFLGRLGFRPVFLRLRDPGYALLSGEGVEIGAFEHPAKLPQGCRVSYADAITPEQAAKLFPEVDASRLMPVTYVVDLDVEGLKAIASGSLDFVIACHVIEHVANPGRLVSEMVRVVKTGGHVVIAAPDRDFTFDRNRAVTSLATLERYFREGRPPVGPEDYREMIEAMYPELRTAGSERIRAVLEDFHRRREHLSVWTAAGFKEFLAAAFGWCGAVMENRYEVFSDRNRFEYFGVWRRSA